MSRNERFARARRALRVTTGQLAELVADHIHRSTGRRPPIDADHVGRIERGVITWPNQVYRSAFRAVLAVDSDAALGFFSRRSSSRDRGQDVDVDARLLLLAGAALHGSLGHNDMDALSAGLDNAAVPVRIGQVDVEDLQRAIDGMERADHAAGGRTVVRSLALGQLAWALDAVRLASFRTSDVRSGWMAAVARLGRLAGFMSTDARDHSTARRCFVLALQLASEADSWLTRMNVLSGMARQALHLQEAEAALQLAALARAGESTAGATTRAVVRVIEARAFGVLGRAAEAQSAVDEAENLYAKRCPQDDPRWLWFYDDAQFFGDTGHALYPLALAGRNVDAVRRLRLAIELHDVSDARGKAFSVIKLATLQTQLDSAESASPAVAAAIAAVKRLRSGRALDYLGDLGRILRRTGTEDGQRLAAEVSATLLQVRRV